MTPADYDAARALLLEEHLSREEIARRMGLPLRQVRAALRGLPGQQRGGRKPGRTQTEAVMVRFTAEQVARLDAARGDTPRAAWVLRAALAALAALAGYDPDAG